MKQLIAGLIAPTEWVEALPFAATGSMVSISSKIGMWFWNWGDNTALTVFKDDTTYGMFKAIAAAIHGDYSQFSFFYSWDYLADWLAQNMVYFNSANYVYSYTRGLI